MSRHEDDGPAPTPPRRPRLADVAAAVGMSPASVSLVLRGAPGPSAATRERVLEAADRMGFRPDRTASLLARRRSRLVGVLMDVRSSYHGELVEEVLDALEQHGLDPVLSTVTRSRGEDRAVETLLDSRCEALVLLGPDAPASRLRELDRLLPVVVVGGPPRGPGLDVVRADDPLGVALVVGHLAGLGHRDIAYVDGGPGAISAGRREGYERAMAQRGLGAAVRVVPGDRSEGAGTAAARRLLALDRLPTAVAAFNDRIAVEVRDALARNGIDVPGTVSVAGYDDDPVSRLAHVDLTTVSQSSAELMRHAVAAVVERLDGGRTGHREVVVPPALVVRTSTAPPRTSG
jgi:DNA-binding LacI/PurR family transcriptional regulator